MCRPLESRARAVQRRPRLLQSCSASGATVHQRPSPIFRLGSTSEFSAPTCANRNASLLYRHRSSRSVVSPGYYGQYAMRNSSTAHCTLHRKCCNWRNVAWGEVFPVSQNSPSTVYYVGAGLKGISRPSCTTSSARNRWD